MKTTYKIASGFAPFSPCTDRFNVKGYRPPMTLEEQMEAASAIQGLTGTGLDYPYQFTDAAQVKPLLKKYKLEFVTLELGLYPDAKWKSGTYTAPDPGVRRDAIEMSKKALDVAAELGSPDVLMWPGQDGFDYVFQTDYRESWKLFADAVGEIASHRPEMKIALEYKRQEPRAHCFVRNAGVLLNLLKDVNLPNVGGCLDLGHSLAAGENAGEAVALLSEAGKLFQVHVNDNYRDWDHDLIIGSVHFWETLEFFYWLRRCGWDGWFILDIFPYREDGSSALQEGVNRVQRFLDLAEKIDGAALRERLLKADAIGANALIWEQVVRR